MYVKYSLSHAILSRIFFSLKSCCFVRVLQCCTDYLFFLNQSNTKAAILWPQATKILRQYGLHSLHVTVWLTQQNICFLLFWTVEHRIVISRLVPIMVNNWLKVGVSLLDKKSHLWFTTRQYDDSKALGLRPRSVLTVPSKSLSRFENVFLSTFNVV